MTPSTVPGRGKDSLFHACLSCDCEVTAGCVSSSWVTTGMSLGLVCVPPVCGGTAGPLNHLCLLGSSVSGAAVGNAMELGSFRSALLELQGQWEGQSCGGQGWGGGESRGGRAQKVSNSAIEVAGRPSWRSCLSYDINDGGEK